MNQVLRVVVLISLMTPLPLGAQEITREMIQKKIEDYLRDEAPKGMELMGWELLGGKELPLRGTVQEVSFSSGSKWQQTTPIGMLVKYEDGREEKLWARLRLRAACHVVVATRPLPIGHKISFEDVSLVVQECWKGSDAYYCDVQEVIGKQMWRPVSRNEPLKRNVLKEAVAIQRGASVVIVAEKGRLRVEAGGRALEKGRQGEGIRVQNVLSGKELYATIVDGTTVKVEF
jgi:flagella basal body P-ring formation protein FlgA